MMSKPIRYVLLLVVLSVAVCLLATAAGYYTAGLDDGFGWGVADATGNWLVYVSIESSTSLEIGSHHLKLPFSWIGCVLLSFFVGTALCLWVATVLSRPLFTAETKANSRPNAA